MKNNFKIYLISGKAHSGKSSISKFIKNYYEENNKKFIITEYSKYIKLFAKEFYNWDFNNENKPRTFLQNLGLFIRKDLNMPHFFINRMLEDLKIYEKFLDGIIISDVRYKDEIAIIKKNYNNVISINVKSPFEQSTLNEKEKNHESEHDLDNYQDFDYVIVNNKDIKYLKDSIAKIVKE